MRVAALVVITLATRILGQWSQVFVDGHVLFRGEDAWYHLRLAAYLRENWPHLLWNDWFANPLGQPKVGWPPLTTYTIGLPFLSENQMEVWAAFLPPIVGALTIVAVYFLTKEILRNSWYAFAAALLVAILPTELFHRTMLGFTDHHMFEMLFTTLSLLFILKMRESFKWSLPLGVSLGLLFLAWDGAAFIMLILLIGAIIQWYYFYFQEGIDYARWGFGLSLASLIALLMFLPYGSNSYSPIPNFASLLAGILVPLALVGLSWLIKSKVRFLLVTLLSGVVLVTVLVFTLPTMDIFSGIFGRGDSAVVSEMTPATPFSLFSNYGLALILGVIGFCFYVREENEYVIPTFFLLTFLANLAHVRYGYYFTIPLCIMAIYLTLTVVKKLQLRRVVAIVVVVFLLMSSLVNTIRLATYENDITPARYEAYYWLRENTPSQDISFYEPVTQNANYLTLTLWDYNHWLIYIARRSPLTHPSGNYYSDIMQFFVDGQDPTSYIAKLYGKEIPLRYVVIDKDMLESNWVAWATGSVAHSYLDSLWAGDASGWHTLFSNEEVKILEKVREP